MSRRNPDSFRALYWLGGALFLLFVGVGLLIWLRPRATPEPPPDPERLLIWLYPDSQPDSGLAVIVVESRIRHMLSAVAFRASSQVVGSQGPANPVAAQRYVVEQTGRKIHHRLFLPLSVVGQLVDAAGGIMIGDKHYTGQSAVIYIQEPGGAPERRAATVLLALGDSARTRGLRMGTQEALRLAGQVESDMDLSGLPDRLRRWSTYPSPQVESQRESDLRLLGKWLLPDPEPIR